MTDSNHEAQYLPERGLVFKDTSVDGTLEMTIWRDPTLLNDLMKEAGVASMGTLRIRNLENNELVYQGRIPLSEGALSTGPTLEEVEYWSSLIEKYTPSA